MGQDDLGGIDGVCGMKPVMRNAATLSDDPRALLDIGRTLIEHEAVLIEEQRWDEWLDLYTEDCVYWVPAWRHDDVLASDPEQELSLIYYSSRAGLEDRVLRIKSPNSPAGHRMARTTHMVANIRLDDGEADGIHLKSSWATHVFSPRFNSTDTFFGQVHHTLVLDDDKWRIQRKKIILMNDYIASLLDIYCL